MDMYQSICDRNEAQSGSDRSSTEITTAQVYLESFTRQFTVELQSYDLSKRNFPFPRATEMMVINLNNPAKPNPAEDL